MTLANRITSARFLLTLVYFALLTFTLYRRDPGLITAAFGVFVATAGSDLLDGYLARRRGQVTHFGRIADPVVDKILVCGSLMFFLRIDPLPGVLPAWFAVVVMAREFLVSGIRGAMEAAGIPFGATFWGKQKTLLQNVLVGTALGYAAWLPGADWARGLTYGLMWLTLVSTVISGGIYLVEARHLFRSGRV